MSDFQLFSTGAHMLVWPPNSPPHFDTVVQDCGDFLMLASGNSITRRETVEKVSADRPSLDGLPFVLKTQAPNVRGALELQRFGAIPFPIFQTMVENLLAPIKMGETILGPVDGIAEAEICRIPARSNA